MTIMAVEPIVGSHSIQSHLLAFTRRGAIDTRKLARYLNGFKLDIKLRVSDITDQGETVSQDAVCQ